MITTILSCLCCRRKQEIKTSNAPHRSLPDIPIAEPACDNNSELYATVGDKVQDLPQGRSPSASLKKQTSVSQHSSISQADDISSPYARVRSPPHAYDKLRRMEHPYAQVVQPGTAAGKGYTSISVREPLANLLPQNMPNQTTAKRRQILGDSHYATVSDDSDEMYAAIDDPGNQGDLYTSGSETYAQIQPPNAMTVSVEINTGASSRPQPPLVQSLHNTVNDALDSVAISSSNKTSSTTPNRLSNHSNMVTSGDEHPHGLPSHLVPSTGSIEGGNLRAQTFVQHSRQASSSSCTSSVGNLGSPKPEKRQANSPLPPTPKTLKHQANNFFSTSNQSMIGTGSVASSNTTTANSGRNSVASVIECGGVGSTAPNRENMGNKSGTDIDSTTLLNGTTVSSKQKKSPSKDLEGMYAKVMKKNKLSKVPSQNSSPVPLRKDGSLDSQYLKQQFQSDSDMSQLNGSGSLHGGSPNRNLITAQRNSTGNCQNKDPGYETIPGDNVKATMEAARKSADYAQIQKLHRNHLTDGGATVTNALVPSSEGHPLSVVVAQGIGKVSLGSLEICHGIDEHYERSFTADTEPGYESLPDTRGSINDPGYETLNRGSNRPESDSDPNYEILRPAGSKPSTMSATSGINKLRGDSSGDTNRDSDGYSSIRETTTSVHPAVKNSARNRLDFGARGVGPVEDDDTDSSTPGYSSIKEKDEYDPGYSVISERKNPPAGHDYASITEEAKKRKPNINNNLEPDDESDIYSSIPHTASGTLTLPSPSAAIVIGASSLGASSLVCVGPTIEADRNSVGAGMGTLSSSPGYSSISETRTTPSSTDGDGSTSSPDQLIGYSKHNSNTNTTVTTNNSMSRISSNYESLTGSESDPNYESVKYLNVKENPYERLHNESGIVVAGSSDRGGVECVPKSLTNDSLTTDSDTATPTPVTQTLIPAGMPNARRAIGTPDSDGTAPARFCLGSVFVKIGKSGTLLVL
uniref:Uncharacterized protein n=1 Tax=Anopheles culicifacies TaxID=139723 RepID=A0A182LTV8_9DIPT